MMVGNKSDLAHLRQVDVSEGKSFAEKKKLFFLETSASEGTNVDEAFTTLLEAIYHNHQNDGGNKIKKITEGTTTVKVTDTTKIVENQNGDQGGCKC
jgi:20S proteasome alpha/beta subunit